MKKEKHYVLGFAYAGSRVALIRKERPEWQKGKLNGIGGKVEKADLSPEHAMIREFKEETGLQSYAGEWEKFATVTFPDDVLGGKAIVHCFRASTIDIMEAQKMTDEWVLIPFVEDVFRDYDTVPHLEVLLPMALDSRYIDCELTIK